MKKHTCLHTALFILLLAICGNITAQNKGSFETNITFQGNPRQLALYVPTNYDSTQKYSLMVCLHGLGDNAVNYRNSLTVSSGASGFHAFMPTTIFVCPEAATTTSDYFDGNGGEQVIQSSIDYAKQNYNIDDSEILLQGFSLGGRAALRYGLANPAKFKGLLLNTPAVQGVKEASNKSVYTFNYSNASQIPIYITHGGTDIFYTSPIDSVYRNLVLNNGIVKLKRFPSMGHIIPAFPNQDSLKFFDQPNVLDYDLQVVEVMLPSRICGNKSDGAILVRNAGKQPITAVTYEYSTGGPGQQEDWTGTINASQHAIIPLPFLSFSGGYYTVSVKVKALNTSVQDENPANDSAQAEILAVSAGKTLPYSEGFDSPAIPPLEWDLKSSGDVYSAWDWFDDVKLTGAGSAGAVNTILIFDNLNRKEDLLSPVLDLTSIPSPHLTFDLAYNYHKFTPPTATQEVDFADTFEVLVSTNCGNSFTSVFRRGGADLATFPTPIMNPVTLQSIFISPGVTNWQKVLIPLSAFSTSNTAVVCFRYISALGGSIHIDNVSFGNNATGIDVPAATEIRLYPNPANDYITIEAGEELISVKINDISGKTVYTGTGAGTQTCSVNTSGFAAGVYLVETATKKGTTINKMVVSR